MNEPREWSRGPQWRSTKAREDWAPVLRRSQRAWEELEVMSVSEGIRPSALVFLEEDELPRASADCAGAGLSLIVLTKEGGRYRAAVAWPELARSWPAIWRAGDDEAMGALLGFPECCVDFFLCEWKARGSRDVVRAMPTVDGPWQSNILLRQLGVRLVPFLPCSGDCAEAAAFGRRIFDVGDRHGLDVDAIEALLRLPVSFDAVGEVAIIETPYFRFMAGVDPGEDGVRGRAGEDVPLPSVEANGFYSRMAMEAAHALVLRAVRRPGIRPWDNAVDFGCGDGALVRLLSEDAYGVEIDPTRAEAARRRGVKVFEGEIAHSARPDWIADWDLALLMPGRLVEMTPSQREHFLAFLKERADRIVAYAYGDWLEVKGGLRALAESVGLRIVGLEEIGGGAEAAEVEVA